MKVRAYFLSKVINRTKKVNVGPVFLFKSQQCEEFRNTTGGEGGKGMGAIFVQWGYYTNGKDGKM